MLDDRPFGLIQRYAIAAYPEYLEDVSAVCPVPPGAVSVDYLIGEPDLRGRGVGPAMIAALENAGFERIAEGELAPDNPRDPRDHYVYALRANATRA